MVWELRCFLYYNETPIPFIGSAGFFRCCFIYTCISVLDSVVPEGSVKAVASWAAVGSSPTCCFWAPRGGLLPILPRAGRLLLKAAQGAADEGTVMMPSNKTCSALELRSRYRAVPRAGLWGAALQKRNCLTRQLHLLCVMPTSVKGWSYRGGKKYVRGCQWFSYTTTPPVSLKA